MRRIIFLAALFLLAFTSINFAMSKSKKAKDLRIINATKQAVHAGIKGGMNGTTYTIKLVLQTAQLITYDSLCLAEGLRTNVSIQYPLNDWNMVYKVNDTIILTSYVTDREWADFTRKSGTPNSITPSAFNQLIYSIGTKKKIISLPDFVKLTALNQM